MAMIITIAKGVFVCFCSLILYGKWVQVLYMHTIALHALGKEE